MTMPSSTGHAASGASTLSPRRIPPRLLLAIGIGILNAILALGAVLRPRSEAAEYAASFDWLPWSVATTALLGCASVITLVLWPPRSIRDNALASTMDDAIANVSVRSDQFLRSITSPLLTQPAAKLEPCGVMLIGIDGFEGMLHAHGRLTADAALEAVARSLTHSVRASDIVGRVGYDGFAVVLSAADPAVVMLAARRIRDAIARIEVSVANNGKLELGASLGITVRNSTDTMEAAFARAHLALQQAAEEGCSEIRMA